MTLSKYIHLFRCNDEYFIYSTLSNSLAKIDEDTYGYLVNNHQDELNKNQLDEDIVSILKNMKILDSDDKNEISKIRFSTLSRRFNPRIHKNS